MVEIFLNIYDITSLNTFVGCLGLGLYHTGVQIGKGEEYSFGAHEYENSGVCQSTPRDGMGSYRFKRTIFMGVCNLSNDAIDEIISDLEVDFSGSSYNIFKKNCNHFSNELCIKLLGKTVPSFLFNVTNCLKSIKCLLSRKIIKGGFDLPDTKAKDSLYLGKKRIETKRTRDFEMSLLSSSSQSNFE